MSDDWMNLFYGSPVLSVVNLLAKLAPISEPRDLFVDEKPIFNVTSEVLTSAANLHFEPPKIKVTESDDDIDGLDYEMAERYKSEEDEDDEGDDDRPAWLSDDDEEDDEDDDEPELDEQTKQSDQFNRYYYKQ